MVSSLECDQGPGTTSRSLESGMIQFTWGPSLFRIEPSFPCSRTTWLCMREDSTALDKN